MSKKLNEAIQYLKEVYDITPKGHQTKINTCSIISAMDFSEFESILKKLEVDYKAIKILEQNAHEADCYEDSLLPHIDYTIQFTEQFPECYRNRYNDEFLNIENKGLELTEEMIATLRLLKSYWDISPKGEQVSILSHELSIYINRNRFGLIIQKLAKDFSLFELIETQSYQSSADDYNLSATIIFSDRFIACYNQTVGAFDENEKKAGEELDRLLAESNAELHKRPDSNRVYWLTYSEKSRKLVLNDCFVIAKTNLNSANDNFLSYIFQNQNREISLTEVQEKGKAEIKRDFHKVLDDLNFRGAVRKLFFDVSKTTITFHNPVSKKQVQEAGIELIQLSDFIRNNPK